MESRLANILDATIEGFIKTGEPVSSDWLYNRYDFGIKPAMIRLELNDLTDQGFLEQPHHSAGRVPSDRGYEFFAKRILERERPSSNVFGEDLRKFFENSDWPDFVEVLSQELGVLGVVDDMRRGEVYKKGLDGLVGHLDWDSPLDVKEVIKDFENLEDRLNGLFGELKENRVQVFVGKKSPVTKSRNLSVVARECDCNGASVMFLAVGPKRMDYQKVINLFNSI